MTVARATTSYRRSFFVVSMFITFFLSGFGRTVYIKHSSNQSDDFLSVMSSRSDEERIVDG